MHSQSIELTPEIDGSKTQRLAYLANIGERVVKIAHEARSPLTTILLGLDHCQKLNLSENDQKRISLARDEADRLRRLIDDLLFQIKSPPPLEALLSTRLLELNSLIEDSLSLIRPLPVVVDKKIIFVSNASIVWIKGDRDKLKQVLINLVTNACEAIEAGEEVLWKISPDATGERVCISLRNGGRPISSHLMSKLCTSWVTTKPGGTGLELAISKQIIEAHEGKLTIDSSVDRGTRVNIDLPLFKIKNIATPGKISSKRKAIRRSF
ncbi:MAG: ATP-binding protein [Pleurocapsa sp. MO_226.B13]|nr:ATP-binding protein [Pleurocapsa sp. MO_226.B13]